MSNTYNITISIASLSVVMNALDSDTNGLSELLYRCSEAEEDSSAGSIMAEAAEAAADLTPAAPPFTPDVDETADVVEEADTLAPAEAVIVGIESDDDDINPAYGADAKNAAKLAWAKLRVVAYDDDGNMELVKLDDVEIGEGYHEIVGENDMAETYVNLYREANGYAKVGSSTFSSRANAGAVRRSSNLIGTVGLGAQAIVGG